MQMKKEIVFEIVKGDNTYRYSMPETAPLGEIYDVGFQILKAAVQLQASSIQQNEASFLAQQVTPRAEESAVVNSCDSACSSDAITTEGSN